MDKLQQEISSLRLLSAARALLPAHGWLLAKPSNDTRMNPLTIAIILVVLTALTYRHHHYGD
jgi:hypothetical protein